MIIQPKLQGIQFTYALDAILAETANLFNVDVECIKRKDRRKEVSQARYFYFRYAFKYTAFTKSTIALHVNKSHDSVCAGLHAVNDWVSVDPKLRKLDEILDQRIKSNELFINTEIETNE